MRQIMETGCDDFATSPLAEYYHRFRPASAAAVLGKPKRKISGTISGMADVPLSASPMPR